MSCHIKTKAERVYLKRLAATMAVYIVLVFATTILVRHIGVSGWLLYVVAVIPCLPILRLVQVVAIYLHEEKDEFQRLLVVRAILAGASVTLFISAVSDFLRSYTDTGDLPPFTIFILFWTVFGAAQGIQSYRNRVQSDEK